MKNVEIIMKDLTRIDYKDVDYICIERGEQLKCADLEKDELYLQLGWQGESYRETATFSLDEIANMNVY